MKTLFRLVSILMVIALLAAGLYQIFNNYSSSLSEGGSQNGPAFSQEYQNGSDSEGAQNGAAMQQRQHNEGSFSGSVYLGLVENIAKIAAITLGVVIFQKIFEIISRNSAAAAVQLK